MAIRNVLVSLGRIPRGTAKLSRETDVLNAVSLGVMLLPEGTKHPRQRRRTCCFVIFDTRNCEAQNRDKTWPGTLLLTYFGGRDDIRRVWLLEPLNSVLPATILAFLVSFRTPPVSRRADDLASSRIDGCLQKSSYVVAAS